MEFITEVPENQFMKEGGSFGELALLTGKPRAATVKCETACLFGVLEKKYFQLILKSLHLKEINEKIDFMKEVVLFQKIPITKMNVMVYNMRKRVFFKGNYLYKENEIADTIFITKKGEFLIESLAKKMHIGVIGAKEVVGFEEVSQNLLRKYSIRCLSAICEVFALKKKDFRKIFGLKDEIIQEMMEFSLMREGMREELIKKTKTFREEIKKALMEKVIRKKPKMTLNQTIGGFSEDFSIKSPFEKNRAKGNNRSMEECPKKEFERISIRKGNSHRKEDISKQIEIIVNAKEKIFHKICQNKADFEGLCRENRLISTETANGLKKERKRKVENILKKRLSLNKSNLL